MGAALAGFRSGRRGVAGPRSHRDATRSGSWFSLVVVIIGGMGSLAGAAVGSVLYGLVFAFAVAYLPTTGNNCCTQYSVVLTFVLMALVLAFRPQGLFGRAG